MARAKYDGVIEAVRYGTDGQIAWVRLYERRGPVFSDHVMVDRPELVSQLKAGKRFVVGRRKPYLAGTFDVSHPLQLVPRAGGELLVAGAPAADGDRLEGVSQV